MRVDLLSHLGRATALLQVSRGQLLEFDLYRSCRVMWVSVVLIALANPSLLATISAVDPTFSISIHIWYLKILCFHFWFSRFCWSWGSSFLLFVIVFSKCCFFAHPASYQYSLSYCLFLITFSLRFIFWNLRFKMNLYKTQDVPYTDFVRCQTSRDPVQFVYF